MLTSTLVFLLFQADAAASAGVAPPLRPAKCGHLLGSTHVLEFSPMAARQGTTLRYSLQRLEQYGMVSTPLRCGSDWRASDARLATLDSSAGTIHIHEDAPRGAEVRLSYLAAGRRWETALRVVGKDEVVVIGSWTEQPDYRCGAGRVLKELVFTGRGTYSATYEPFESYQDYWGTYDFDETTGTLTLQVTGGNSRPSAVSLQTHATVNAKGELLIDRIFADGSDGVWELAPGCRRTFHAR